MEPRSSTDRPSAAAAAPERRSPHDKPGKREKRKRREKPEKPGKRDRRSRRAAIVETMSATLEIVVADRRWRRLVPSVERLVRQAVLAGGGAGSVVLDRDLRIRRLNARHRGKNRPTNVLTFETPRGVPGGDIIVALETVRREAIAAGRRPRHHLAHLVVHGALHLRGHDHHRVGDARRMEMQETRILHRLGVPNPWKPRPSPLLPEPFR